MKSNNKWLRKFEFYRRGDTVERNRGKKGFTKVYIVILCIVIIIFLFFVPLMLDWFVFGNDIHSNLTNGEWAGFLGSYIGALIGGIVSIIGIILTIRYTQKEIELSYKQYEEQKRLHNLPILDCELHGYCVGKEDGALEIRSEYTFQNNEWIPYTMNFKIYNIGIGAATNLAYAMDVDEKRQDGTFWEQNNRTIKCNDYIIQSVVIFLPQGKTLNFSMILLYKDVLGNQYEKKIKIVCEKLSNEELFLEILYQEDGSCVENKAEELYYVVKVEKENT